MGGAEGAGVQLELDPDPPQVHMSSYPQENPVSRHRAVAGGSLARAVPDVAGLVKGRAGVAKKVRTLGHKAHPGVGQGVFAGAAFAGGPRWAADLHRGYNGVPQQRL